MVDLQTKHEEVRMDDGLGGWKDVALKPTVSPCAKCGVLRFRPDDHVKMLKQLLSDD